MVVQALAGRTSPIGLTWWYHTAVTVGTGIPLALGYPAPPKWPSLQQQGMLVFIVVCQLCGQICLNRGFSLVSATKGAAINVLQVGYSMQCVPCVHNVSALTESDSMLVTQCISQTCMRSPGTCKCKSVPCPRVHYWLLHA